MRQYDILTIGRSSLDLYANDIGAAFPDIKSFGAFVGGCPTNISVGVPAPRTSDCAINSGRRGSGWRVTPQIFEETKVSKPSLSLANRNTERVLSCSVSNRLIGFR